MRLGLPSFTIHLSIFLILQTALLIPKVLAHGGDGHVDMPPLNQLTGKVDSESSSWFLGMSASARMGVADKSMPEVTEVTHGDEHAEPGGDAHDGDHTRNANTFLLSPSLGYQLNSRWGFFASETLDFAGSVFQTKTSATKPLVYGDPSVSAVSSSPFGTSGAFINSFTLIAPVSEESKELGRRIGVGYSALANLFIGPRWDFLPFLSVNHYFSQKVDPESEQPQTNAIVGSMFRYSIRSWNTAFQTGVRFQEGLMGSQSIQRMLHFVPIRADLNVQSWSVSFYPEIRRDLQRPDRNEVFAVLEGIYSLASLGRPTIQAASGPSEEIRHDHESEESGHNHTD